MDFFVSCSHYFYSCTSAGAEVCFLSTSVKGDGGVVTSQLLCNRTNAVTMNQTLYGSHTDRNAFLNKNTYNFCSFFSQNQS